MAEPRRPALLPLFSSIEPRRFTGRAGGMKKTFRTPTKRKGDEEVLDYNPEFCWSLMLTYRGSCNCRTLTNAHCFGCNTPLCLECNTLWAGHQHFFD